MDKRYGEDVCEDVREDISEHGGVNLVAASTESGVCLTSVFITDVSKMVSNFQESLISMQTARWCSVYDSRAPQSLCIIYECGGTVTDICLKKRQNNLQMCWI